MWYRFLEKLHNKILFLLGFGNPDMRANGELRALSYVKSRLSLSGSGKMVVFDVGANVGEYSRAVLDIFPEADLYLFEPQKELFAKLSKEFTNVFKLGLSDKAGVGPIYGNKDKKGLASLYNRNLEHFNLELAKQEDVELGTVSGFCAGRKISRIHLLKLDVEGHELRVLEGAKEMFGNIDFIQFEFGGCNIDSKTFFQDFWRLLSKRYKIYRITGGGLREINRYEERNEIFLTSNYLAEIKKK
ncbi:MAG: FkbM family methyltransferase [bacterium]|nr:FkbM family methyltransferase [bacterium]